MGACVAECPNPVLLIDEGWVIASCLGEATELECLVRLCVERGLNTG